MRRTVCVLLAAGLAFACGGSTTTAAEDAGAPDGAAPRSDAGAPAVGADAGTPGPSLGATPHEGGVLFRVWAPHADRAFVSGDFNGWNDQATELAKGTDGVFSADVPGARAGQAYRYVLVAGGQTFRRADPRARKVQGSQGSSVILDPSAYAWQTANFTPAPRNVQVVYEMHIGSFYAPNAGKPGTWLDAIGKLDALAKLGVNMLEVMPPAEFAGDYSWGYNTAFPFAPETVYGSPDDMRRFVDEAHARGMGVVIDVVNNHWGPQDLPMRCFDGDCLGKQGIYFYTDGRADTPWGPRPDFGRPEVRRYVTDSALAWLEEYRCDGLRWDSVSNIRQAGGQDNPQGAQVLRDAMDAVHQLPNKLMIAEDLYTVDAITRPTKDQGFGFDTQWDAAFFHPVDDTCTAPTDDARSMASLRGAILHAYNGDPLQRVVYSEDHDEVANGRARIPQMISPNDPGSLVARKISTLGAITALTSPGVPMLFMGQEFLQDGSFADKAPLDWSRAQTYAGILAMYTDLVALRKNQHGTTAGLTGSRVEVFHVNDAAKVIAWRRWTEGANDDVVVLANWSKRTFTTYDIGLPRGGTWHVRFDSDDTAYGADFGGTPSADVVARAAPMDGLPATGRFTLGAYTALVLSQ